MCGRFALVTEKRVLELLFEIELLEELGPRYNIAPSEMILVLHRDPRSGGRQPARMKWGLLPFRAAGRAAGKILINARAETVAAKPAFRAAFQSRRALVPASGFYEWRREEKSRQPYFIRLRGGGPLAFGGLFEAGAGEPRVPASCALITTAANGLIAPLHHRMPLIIPRECYRLWLNPGTPAEALQKMMQPYPAEKMDFYPVSRLVNNAAFDHPDCLAREGQA